MNRFLTSTLAAAMLASPAAAEAERHFLLDQPYWDVAVALWPNGTVSCELIGTAQDDTMVIAARESGSQDYLFVFGLPDKGVGPGRATSWRATLEMDMLGRAGSAEWSLNDADFEVRNDRYTSVTLVAASYDAGRFLNDLARYDRLEIFAHDFRLVSVVPLAGSRRAIEEHRRCIENAGMAP